MTDLLEQWSSEVVRQVLNDLGDGPGLVVDSDHLLNEEIIRLLTEQGWQVLLVSSSMELRLAYEQGLRSSPESASHKYLFILQFPAERMPFDIQQAAKSISLSLKDFFPWLSYEILRQLPPAWIPVIYANRSESDPFEKTLGDAQTIDFILENCLNLDFSSQPKLIDWLSLLTDVVLYQLELPEVLLKTLRARVAHNVPQLIQSAAASPARAKDFLQQLWSVYLSSFRQLDVQIADQGDEALTAAAGCLSGSRVLQNRISALLAENLLTPPYLTAETGLPDWIRSGIHYHLDKETALVDRLAALRKQTPPSTAVLSDWTNFAWSWADWRTEYAQYGKPIPSIQSTLNAFQNALEDGFLDWLISRYPALLAQPYLPAPIMVHQLLHNLASRYHLGPQNPLALVVVDGMAVEDWLVVSQEWAKLDLGWQIEERSLLALVPTITPASRQALLSGRLPSNFTGDWLSTQGEEAAWRLFWEEHNLTSANIAYRRGLGNMPTDPLVGLEAPVVEILNQPHLAVVALIVNTLDELVHNSLLGDSGLHQQVRFWASQGYLRTLVSRLLERCATVILTSDHGHIEGQGIGDIPFNEVATERALRARIFLDKEFDVNYKDHPDVLKWPGVGLPLHASVAIPRRLGLFTKPGETGISHGGAALEEVVIPLVTITR